MNRKTESDLRRLRNGAKLSDLIEHLALPTKPRGSRRSFRCPCCSTIQAFVIPNANLAHCFHCQRNFNPIDLLMAERGCSFLEAVDYIERLLPPG